MSRKKEWVSITEIAGVPGLPGTVRGIQYRAKREAWVWRKRAGRGGGREYHISSLPAETNRAIKRRRVTRFLAERKAGFAAIGKAIGAGIDRIVMTDARRDLRRSNRGEK